MHVSTAPLLRSAVHSLGAPMDGQSVCADSANSKVKLHVAKETGVSKCPSEERRSHFARSRRSGEGGERGGVGRPVSLVSVAKGEIVRWNRDF
jgi:hypothetical protein